MTLEQYISFCRVIGFLEGFGNSLKDGNVGAYYDAIASLSEMIDEIWKEAQDGT